MDLRRAFELNKFDVARLSDDQLRGIVGQIVTVNYKDRQENQLLYYKPVSPVAERVHQSGARYLCIGGGNGASKTSFQLLGQRGLRLVLPVHRKQFSRFVGALADTRDHIAHLAALMLRF